MVWHNLVAGCELDVEFEMTKRMNRATVGCLNRKNLDFGLPFISQSVSKKITPRLFLSSHSLARVLTNYRPETWDSKVIGRICYKGSYTGLPDENTPVIIQETYKQAFYNKSLLLVSLD